MTAPVTPTLLLILDGWGQAPAGPGNAVSLAKMPTVNSLMSRRPYALLACSGRAVGLPEGYMGNSEVGHMNIGAGRVVYQDMTRIDMAIEDGEFAADAVIAQTIAAAKASGGALHLWGLLSDGGVHSHIFHLYALLEAAEKAGVPALVHAFMDGRDTSPTSGIGFVRGLSARLGKTARIASLSGRYYAMDRDKRWDRTFLAYEALVHGKGQVFADAVSAMEAAYAAGQTDEFITPRLIAGEGEQPCRLRDGDAVFFFNFRADRARQLAHALYDVEFSGFDRGVRPKLSAFSCMTAYESDLPVPAAFVRQNLARGLGEEISRAGLKQLRIAETEKYAHVTYFFNGGVEEPFPGEERRLIPSPRDVATYDLKPEMSAAAVAETFVKEWSEGGYAFGVCNLANPDMVGHTGIIPAAVAACEAVDAAAARIVSAVLEKGGRVLMTADHGNAEEMIAPDGTPQTAHSKNPVALVLADDEPYRLRSSGKLGDIAPTVLALMGLPVPPEMTGQSLLEEA